MAEAILIASRDVGVYARIVIPLDGPKERINCNDLYELRIEKEASRSLEITTRIRATSSFK